MSVDPHRNGKRPLIGVSAGFHDFGDYGGVGVQRPVLAAGGLPVTLAQLPDAIEPALDVLDGVILAPGRDIEPRRYGQDPHELLAATDPQRDAFELLLAASALERGLPILGMCRGIQLLNVALGGTLAQDVSLLVDDHPTDPGWRAWKRVEKASLSEAPVPEHPRHDISITAGSLLAQALGTTTISVSSFHHQAIDRLGRRPLGGGPVARRRAGGDRTARAAGARGAVGAPGGVARRPAVPGVWEWFVSAAVGQRSATLQR